MPEVKDTRDAEDLKAAQLARWRRATASAKRRLVPGDRIRVTKCPGTKRWITFSGWSGDWIVSKSGIDDYAASSIDRLNGEPVDFCDPTWLFQI